MCMQLVSLYRVDRELIVKAIIWSLWHPLRFMETLFSERADHIRSCASGTGLALSIQTGFILEERTFEHN